MKWYQRWYIQVLLVFIGITIMTIVFILYDQATTGDVLYQERLSPAKDETAHFRFTLDEEGENYVLVIEPKIESGWGEPAVDIRAELFSPDNQLLLSIDEETDFGGTITYEWWEPAPDYAKKFEFTAPAVGEYELQLTPLSAHIESILVTIGKRENDQ